MELFIKTRTNNLHPPKDKIKKSFLLKSNFKNSFTIQTKKQELLTTL